jgi:hypothetical protein
MAVICNLSVIPFDLQAGGRYANYGARKIAPAFTRNVIADLQ